MTHFASIETVRSPKGRWFSQSEIHPGYVIFKIDDREVTRELFIAEGAKDGMETKKA